MRNLRSLFYSSTVLLLLRSEEEEKACVWQSLEKKNNYLSVLLCDKIFKNNVVIVKIEHVAKSSLLIQTLKHNAVLFSLYR